MQLENSNVDKILRQAAAWEKFENRHQALRNRLREKAAKVSAPSWWQRWIGLPLLSRGPVFMPVSASTEEGEEPWQETEEVEVEPGLRLRRTLRKAPSGDIHLALEAFGEGWQEAEVLRIEYRTLPHAEPERGVACLRWSEARKVFVTEVNLGRVGRGVGVDIRGVAWEEVMEEEAGWAILHAANDPSLWAWKEGWAQHRQNRGEKQ